MECTLVQGELIRLDGGKNGIDLRCRRGVVWLTCGDGRDYLLSAGNTVKLSPRQTTVAEALISCEFLLGEPQEIHGEIQRPVIRFAPC